MTTYNEMFEYRDGKLFNRYTRNSRAKVGERAGCGGDWRYRRVTLKGKKVFEHRIIWEMHNGPIPDGMVIDHINGDHSDNRIENLRVATHSQNLRNSDRYRNATGVQQLPSGRFSARLQMNGKQTHIGTFNTPEEARHAYLEARSNG